jgi:zinc/manganese transport system ATP-binding protein
MTAITLSNLTLGYDRHPAVHHLDTTIQTGSLTAIVGPNGAGKSTLLKGIVGALSPLQGTITRTRNRIAYLPQQAEIDRSFPLPVRDLVAMGLWAEIGAFGRLRRVQTDRISTALSAVGLSGFDQRSIAALSGGQMQRVLFARLLLQDAEVILLDEPFTAIDAKTAADLMGIVHRWHGDGRTVVAVLHDMDAVRTHFPDTLVIARTLVAHGPTANVLTPDNLFRARQMCEAFDDDAAVCAPHTRGAA